MICALCSCAFAVGRHFVTLLVLGLQVQLHQAPAQEHRVGDTDVDIGIEMAVGSLVASGCSLSLRTEGTLLRVRKPDKPQGSAHDETLKHARTTRWCQLGWVFPVNRHCHRADEVSRQVPPSHRRGVPSQQVFLPMALSHCLQPPLIRSCALRISALLLRD